MGNKLYHNGATTFLFKDNASSIDQDLLVSYTDKRVVDWQNRLKLAKENKEHQTCLNICDELYAVATGKQGYRNYMEDMTICQQNVTNTNVSKNKIDMFVMLDGHGTHYSSVFCKNNMIRIMSEMLASIDDISNKEKMKNLLNEYFYRVDTELFTEGTKYFNNEGVTDKAFIRKDLNNDVFTKIGGTTCTMLLMCPTYWIVANIGDSRTFLVDGTNCKFSTIDHAPNVESEKTRIYNGGHFIACPGGIHRLDANIAISRSFGDFYYKTYSYKKMENSKNTEIKVEFPNGDKSLYVLSSVPDITFGEYSDKDSYFCLASDGLFGNNTNEDLINFIENCLAAGELDLSVICRHTVDTYCKDLSSDNVSLMLIPLKAFNFNVTSEGSGIQLMSYDDNENDIDSQEKN